MPIDLMRPAIGLTVTPRPITAAMPCCPDAASCCPDGDCPTDCC